MSSQRKTATAARPSRGIGGWADRAKAGDAGGLEPSGSHIPEQQRRLPELMGRWWEARDSGNLLPPNEQAELEALPRVALRASAPDESD